MIVWFPNVLGARGHAEDGDSARFVLGTDWGCRTARSGLAACASQDERGYQRDDGSADRAEKPVEDGVAE